MSKSHNPNGPAVYLAGVQYWFEGSQIMTTKKYQELADVSDEEMLALVIKYGKPEDTKLDWGALLRDMMILKKPINSIPTAINIENSDGSGSVTAEDILGIPTVKKKG